MEENLVWKEVRFKDIQIYKTMRDNILFSKEPYKIISCKEKGEKKSKDI